MDISIPVINMNSFQKGDNGEDYIDIENIKMYYYNGYLSDWEPFLENFDLKYNQKRSLNFQSMNLELPTPVNFNITERCVQNLMDTYNTWMMSPSFDKDNEVKKLIKKPVTDSPMKILEEEDDED